MVARTANKIGFLVTGTDTGVGKTLVSAALLHALHRRGYSTVGMKPIVAGVERIDGTPRFADVEALRRAGSVAAALELVSPVRLQAAIAPHIAAAREAIEIDIEQVLRAFNQLRGYADAIVVEGVGGFIVPLTAHTDTSDLAQRMALPVILVVGMRLGCLNHALLSVAAIQAKGLRLAGWIANCIDPQMLALEENIAALRQRIAAPLVGRIGFDPQALPQDVADHIDVESLLG